MLGTQETRVPSSWELRLHTELGQLPATETHFPLRSQPLMRCNPLGLLPPVIVLQTQLSTHWATERPQVSWWKHQGWGGKHLREMELETTAAHLPKPSNCLTARVRWSLFPTLNKHIRIILESPGIPNIGFC